ncbi:hypothetical protein BBR47_52520 [Brevibacillus brevis NBRC 100599]|uniref:Uncharacterized protein n=1 Tax=Brevibacillus brevis (strain 47 / JCM 6285 / NBRC 100599) TaxID=358681 RepID=C0Z6N0_BREBN|nr:hypothetical protein BBR47_52520 [Brevibacillus brevis NBRC 100599]
MAKTSGLLSLLLWILFIQVTISFGLLLLGALGLAAVSLVSAILGISIV